MLWFSPIDSSAPPNLFLTSPFSQWNGGQNWDEKKELTGQGKKHTLRQKGKREITVMKIIHIFIKQVIHKPVYHLLTNAQPISSSPPLDNYPQFHEVILHDAIWCRMNLWPVQVSCLGSAPSQICVLPVFPPTGQCEKLKIWNALGFVQHHSVTAKISLFYQYYFSPKAKIKHRTWHYEKK